MLQAIGWRRFAYVVGVLCFACFAVLVVVRRPVGSLETAAQAFSAIGIAVGIIAFASVTSAWKVLWWLFPPLGRHVFPLLGGTWSGKVISNWRAPDDTPGADTAGGAEAPPTEIPVTVQISMGFTGLSTRFISGTSELRNRVVAFALLPAREDVPHRLAYLYQQWPNEAQDGGYGGAESKNGPRDAYFYGAAYLSVGTDDRGRAVVLQGPYFTNRNFQRRGNTAGMIELTRSKRR
jgi:hypothetical protein